MKAHYFLIFLSGYDPNYKQMAQRQFVKMYICEKDMAFEKVKANAQKLVEQYSKNYNLRDVNVEVMYASEVERIGVFNNKSSMKLIRR